MWHQCTKSKTQNVNPSFLRTHISAYKYKHGFQNKLKTCALFWASSTFITCQQLLARVAIFFSIYGNENIHPSSDTTWQSWQATTYILQRQVAESNSNIWWPLDHFRAANVRWKSTDPRSGYNFCEDADKDCACKCHFQPLGRKREKRSANKMVALGFTLSTVQQTSSLVLFLICFGLNSFKMRRRVQPHLCVYPCVFPHGKTTHHQTEPIILSRHWEKAIILSRHWEKAVDGIGRLSTRGCAAMLRSHDQHDQKRGGGELKTTAAQSAFLQGSRIFLS